MGTSTTKPVSKGKKGKKVGGDKSIELMEKRVEIFADLRDTFLAKATAKLSDSKQSPTSDNDKWCALLSSKMSKLDEKKLQDFKLFVDVVIAAMIDHKWSPPDTDSYMEIISKHLHELSDDEA